MADEDWQFYVSRKFCWFVEWAYLEGSKREWFRKALGLDWAVKNYKILDGDEYYPNKDAEEYSKFLEDNFRSDSEFFKRFAEKEYGIVANLQNTTAMLLKENLKNKSNKQLADLLMEHIQAYLPICTVGMARPDDFLENKAKEVLKEVLLEKEKNTRNLEEYFKAIITNSRILQYTEEPLDLLRVAAAIQESQNRDLFDRSIEEIKANLPSEIKQLLLRHLEKYSWLKAPTFIQKLAYSPDDIILRLKHLVINENCNGRIKEILNLRNKNEKDFLDLKDQLDFSKEDLNLIEATREFIYLRTYTTEEADSSFFKIRAFLFPEMEARLGLKDNELIHFGGYEIINFLNSDEKPTQGELNKRKEAFAIIIENEKINVMFGHNALKLKEKHTIEKPAQKKLTGAIANKGKATGLARILLSHTEVGKVNKGDILIASMTTPDYIIAMEKAAAFVTDEGGITCHAAIISRELGVPCITGTKIATKVFKDGDKIEVDADNGIVRKL